jgi:alpha-L-rhamnosidase
MPVLRNYTTSFQRLAMLSLFFLFSHVLSAQSRWIWYPGDFEIWLGNQVQTRRTERNAFVPPFWRVYGHNVQVNFGKQINLNEPEEIVIKTEGKYNVTVDGKYIQGSVERIIIPEGKHSINFQVFNDATPPALFVKGKTINSDSTWTVELVHNNSPDNIPSNPKCVYAGHYDLDNPDNPPSQYKLLTKEIQPVTIKQTDHSVLIDFGRETFGYIILKALSGNGKISLYYGESREEALSLDSCETFDHYSVSNLQSGDFTSTHSRAFRFVNVKYDRELTFKNVSSLYEYLPAARRGAFRSSDEELNNIWEVAAYTLELNSREFFIDGIKRDRWVWSGDAVQSYLMNYYLAFDLDAVKRTTWAVRGADPVEAHLNTILDYSLYWFMGIYDYYKYTGDEAFLVSIYPRMVSLMDFVLKRRNADGMIEGLPGDWVFLDWAPMTKEGELSAIQLLLARSLETMGICASLMKDSQKANEYAALSRELRIKITQVFWDPDQKGFIHSRKNGVLNSQITRYSNMFAMMFGYLDSTKSVLVKNNVLVNNKIQKITTPYMRFYELEALSAVGQQSYVTKEIKSYWGGMLKEGATTFWEFYDPNEKGAARYAMYGRPFGKSLCHAWGASPVYLIGKYYLGVRPMKAGYSEYVIEPNLGGLQWIEGKVPTPHGDIVVSLNGKQIKVTTINGKGVLRFQSKTTPSSGKYKISRIGANRYEMMFDHAGDYIVEYEKMETGN